MVGLRAPPNHIAHAPGEIAWKNWLSDKAKAEVGTKLLWIANLGIERLCGMARDTSNDSANYSPAHGATPVGQHLWHDAAQD
jgi:hypothetical protein